MTALPNTFVAEDEGPPRRKFWICGDPDDGWSFIYDEWRNGEWQVGWDTKERWFFEILRYPTEHGSKALVWRREDTDEEVDLASFQQAFDGVAAAPDSRPEDVGLPRH